MSKGTTPSIDDLEPVSNNGRDDEVPELELEPGDSFVGEVRSIERGLGDYESTLVHFSSDEIPLGEQRKYWAPGHVDAQFYGADVQEGDVVGLIKDEEPTKVRDDDGEIVLDDDGEEAEYHRVEVRD